MHILRMLREVTCLVTLNSINFAIKISSNLKLSQLVIFLSKFSLNHFINVSDVPKLRQRVV